MLGVHPSKVRKGRIKLKQRGIITTILPESKHPPVKITRALLEYRVLMQLSRKRGLNWSSTKCAIRAEVLEDMGSYVVTVWIRRPLGFLERVESAANGRYRAKAMDELKGWIAEQEKEFGAKYEPDK